MLTIELHTHHILTFFSDHDKLQAEKKSEAHANVSDKMQSKSSFGESVKEFPKASLRLVRIHYNHVSFILVVE